MGCRCHTCRTPHPEGHPKAPKPIHAWSPCRCHAYHPRRRYDGGILVFRLIHDEWSFDYRRRASRSACRRFVEPAVDIVEILDRLEREDAIAVPALTAEYRAWLIVEARTTRFRDARPVVGRGERLVRQRMGVHNGFGPDSRFHDLTRRYQAAWDVWLAFTAPYPFESPSGLQRSDAAGLRARRDGDHAAHGTAPRTGT